MKRIFCSLLFYISALIFGQNMSDFRYVSVAQSKDFPNDKFDLQSLLSAKLQAKGYMVLSSDRAQASDPCHVLQAELENSSSLLKNKIKVNLKDCKGKEIATFEGRSNLKEYEPGYQEALALAAAQFPNSNATAQLSTITSGKTSVAEINTESPAESAREKTASLQNTVQTYTNGTLTLNRIVLSDSQFILAAANSSVPYATFTESTKKDIFRVKLQDGSQTLGYFENENIIIEKANTDGSFTKEIFKNR